MSNILIVESENDKFFFQALVDELKYNIGKEKKTIWNFSHPLLDNVKEFLNLFAESG